MAEKIIKDMFGKLNKNDEKNMLNFLKEKKITYENYLQLKLIGGNPVDIENLRNANEIGLGKYIPKQQKNVAIKKNNSDNTDHTFKNLIDEDLQCLGAQREFSQCGVIATRSKALNKIDERYQLTEVKPNPLLHERCPKCFKKHKKKIYLKTHLIVASKCLNRKLNKEKIRAVMQKKYAVNDNCQGENNVTMVDCDASTSIKPNIGEGNAKIAININKKKRHLKQAKHLHCMRCGKLKQKSKFIRQRGKISKRRLDSFIKNAARTGGYGYRFMRGNVTFEAQKEPDRKDCKFVKEKYKAMNKVQFTKRRIIFKAIKPKARKTT